MPDKNSNEIVVKDAAEFVAAEAIAGDAFKTSDGRILRLVAVDPNDTPDPEFWACVYADAVGRKWSRFFSSQAEHDTFIATNGYASIDLHQMKVAS